MKENTHAQAIPEQTLQEAKGLLSQALALLQPYLIALTPSERHDLPKMGEKTLSFVEKAHEFAWHNAQLCPPYLNLQMFDIDFTDAHGLWGLQNTSQQLEELVTDTITVAGSEAYQAALVFYNSVKIAAAQDVPGAKAIYEDLRTRFPRGKRRGTE